MQWSDYQRAIFADVAEGLGHTVVIARAGSGKTSTAMEALNHVPRGKSAIMVAFNKSIAKELERRAPRGVDVCTLHSFGFRALRGAYGNVKVDGKKSRAICDQRFGTAFEQRKRIGSLAKATSLAKGMLVDDADGIDAICDRFDIDAGTGPNQRAAFCKDVLWLLEQSSNEVDVIDFDDMIWMPIKHDLRVRGYDRVFVDETQDLNAAQLELVLKACKERGRICAIGDDRQAIYQFRGADENAIARIIERLDAKQLPLSITYRCGKAIARLAAEVVPDFVPNETNPEGMVGDCTIDKMRELAAAGDFILSRTNAPLIGNCLALIKAGKPANIAGRDIGAGLLALIDKSKATLVDQLIDKSKATLVDQLIAWVNEWCNKEIERRLKKDPDADVDDLRDRADCIEALSEGETVTARVRARVESLFSDRHSHEKIILSSVHRAKGLERDRVFMLADTFRRGRSTAEDNIFYVAVSRAKHELWMVTP